ncbi:MAG: class I SAM-dependent methyltransferase [Acidimicrobiia bacterium]
MHQWDSPEYVDEWVRRDNQTDLLRLPMEIAAALVSEDGLAVGRVIDLGSGPGTFLQRLLDEFPEAEGVWVDSSDPMAEIARERLGHDAHRVSFHIADAGVVDDLQLGPADVVVTARMVHHLSEETTRELYAWASATLGDHGYFFNLDHYGSPPGWESRYRSIRRRILGGRRRTESHGHERPFAPLDRHLEWLSAAGFGNRDVAWKAFHTALLVGRIDV